MIDNKDINTSSSASPDEVRLDRWLWAARFYKTRQISAGALKSGHVELNGRKAKPARTVRIGDRLEIRKEGLRYEIDVIELREKRVSAELAANMYAETAQSRERRQEILDQRSLQRQSIRYDGGRPSKKDRRSLARMKRSVN